MDYSSNLSKKQKVTHLSQADWLLQRPDAFVGSMEPTPVRLLTFDDEKAPSSPSLLTTTLRPGFLALANELVTNPLDNCQRDATQRYIKFSWDADKECLVVVNDGSTLPIERLDNGEWAPTMAFGAFQTGSNFDDEATGVKDVAFTAGRNGVGAKGCNVFSRLFRVRIVNAQDRKVFEQTWRDHMRLVEPAKITSAGARKTNETRVEWTPDFARLHTDGDRPPECMPAVCRALAHQAALCAPSHVKVSLDGVAVKLRTPEHFCRALGGVGPLASDTVSVLCKDGSSSSSVVLRLCVAARAEDGREEGDKESVASSSYVFVNATPCPEGSHVKYLYSKIADVLSAKANAKRGSGGQVHVTPSFLRQQAVLVAVLLVEHPRFTSQTKHCLDLPVKDFGWKWEMGEAFRSALERSPLVDRAVQCALEKRDAEAAKATKTSASSRLPSIPKYEPALRRHTKVATLIVCEGDSAANLVRSGLSVVGRKDFGLYPLRGKFLNARGVPSKTVLENKEALELLKILGIQLHFRYDEQSVQKLPYARLMAMTDQDVDGSHIAGLLYNFVDAVAPSLLAAKPDYLSRFATSLIRVTLGKKEKELGFYSQVEYDAWRRAREAQGAPVGTARYFKGLGTSSAALAKEYFRNLAANTIVVRRTEACGDALGLAFDKRRADDRKAFLSGCDASSSYVDYAQAETTVDRFVRDELLPQYATASLVRAIPSVDGFKEAQRKVFFGARVLHLTGDGISVANAAGKIASRTMYHHRGTAMEDTIVGMAADYAGTGNVNLLLPLGQFGTRHKHAAASAAYPKVSLNAPLHTLLFPPADDAVLTHVVDEGVRVEPTLYAPLLPMPLVFGCKGIATGWSTDVPPFHPVDVLDATVRWLEEGTSSSSSSFSLVLVPWYRGFQGTVRAVEAKECGASSSSSTTTLTFAVRGTYEWKKAGTHELHVTELPPFRETESYKEDWVKKELASEILVGERASDTEVHFVLKGCKPSVLEDPVAALGLEKTVSLGNMHLLNARGRLTKYEEPQAILAECAEMRLGVYEKRLAHLVKREQRAVTLAENKARFVQACVSGEVDLRVCADDEEGGKACEALGLAPMAQDDEDEPHKGPSSSYDYLLRLPLRSLTRARAAELLAQADHHRRTWEALRAQTPRALFLHELETLREALTSDPRYAR